MSFDPVEAFDHEYKRNVLSNTLLRTTSQTFSRIQSRQLCQAKLHSEFVPCLQTVLTVRVAPIGYVFVMEINRWVQNNNAFEIHLLL